MASYPLFPLPVVLFPGALLPLHVFEPRYRALLADCAEATHRFAIVEPGDEGESPRAGALGTVARIRAIQPLPDGRSNVVVSGETRVRLDAIEPSPRPYLVGAMTAIDDLPDPQVPAATEIAAVKALAQRYAAALGALSDVERDADLADDPAVLSFQAAALLEWDYPAKLTFLGIRSARERVTRLLVALPALVEDLERRVAVHRNAASNGRGHHHP